MSREHSPSPASPGGTWQLSERTCVLSRTAHVSEGRRQHPTPAAPAQGWRGPPWPPPFIRVHGSPPGLLVPLQKGSSRPPEQLVPQVSLSLPDGDKQPGALAGSTRGHSACPTAEEADRRGHAEGPAGKKMNASFASLKGWWHLSEILRLRLYNKNPAHSLQALGLTNEPIISL